jgi:hypothetical protein
MTDDDFDDGGTPMWRARQAQIAAGAVHPAAITVPGQPYRRALPAPLVINLAPRRGVAAWFRRASPMEACVASVLLLGGAVLGLVVFMVVGLIVWDALTGHRNGA